MVKVIFNNINLQVKEYFKSNVYVVDQKHLRTFKASNLRNYISEEYVRCSLFSKLLHLFENAIPEKFYTDQFKNLFKNYFNNEKCDLFFTDANMKNTWIELKFFIPTNYGSVGNFGKVIRDFIRLLYFSKEENTELYFIMFILCGQYNKYDKQKAKYHSIKKEINNYFSLDKTNKSATFELFFNDKNIFDFRLEDSLKEYNTPNFKKALGAKYQCLPLLYDTVGIRRTIYSDLVKNNHLSESLSFQHYNQNLLCYVFKLERKAKKKRTHQTISEVITTPKEEFKSEA